MKKISIFKWEYNEIIEINIHEIKNQKNRINEHIQNSHVELKIEVYNRVHSFNAFTRWRSNSATISKHYTTASASAVSHGTHHILMLCTYKRLYVHLIPLQIWVLAGATAEPGSAQQLDYAVDVAPTSAAA